ncbi:hypothetical protein CRG98_001222 [Punica granatum]|uniref:Uncharacterized protein n=1 Tax=Punica granatum TaxID=22663 RepID=A0A2I0LCJ9_PUNGR|nr:hypothetical protein CRG98_001222 [Punica granatum]
MSRRSSRVPSLRLGREFPRFDRGLDVSLTPIRATSHHGRHVIRTCNMGSRTVIASSRGRVRLVRNPLNVMARLAKVVEGNGTSGELGAPDGGSRDPTLFTAGT